MDFTFTTDYNNKSLTVMAKALRKTVRKKRNRIIRIFGIFAVVTAMLTSTPLLNDSFELNAKTIIAWLASILIVFVLLFEDRINARTAKKALLPALKTSTTTFNEENYTSATAIGTSVFNYDNIIEIAKSKRYYILIFSKNHAQVYDKSCLEPAKQAEFEKFLQNKLNKKFKNI